MAIIAGIDSGVQNIGLVLLKTDDLTVQFAECINGSNYADFYHYFLHFIRNHTPDHVAFEKPYFTPMTIGKNTRTLEVIGIQKLVLEQASISYTTLSPATIKKTVTGNGRASKEDVIKGIHKLVKFSSKVTNNHITDAAGVAYTAYLKANET